MDFIGKIVRKEFKGFGVFEGVVDSYDSSTGFFKILYEDGDSEDADFSEVSRLSAISALDSDNSRGFVKRVGRKPKKRRSVDRDSGKNLSIDVNLEPKLGQIVENDVRLCVNGDLDLDLNRECIDLNLSVDDNDFSGGLENGGKDRGFDLNLGFNDDDNCGVDGVLDNENTLQNGDHVVCENVPDLVVDERDLDIRGTPEVKLEDEEGSCGGTKTSKRRKVVRDLNSPAAQPVLRRSARRAKTIALSEISNFSAMVVDEANDLSVSGVTVELEEKSNSLDLERVEETPVFPSKIEFPPSSTNVDLEGIHVLDLFSVYSCLRSFSTLLYLSPFELGDLVTALKSKVCNLLIDFIHVSLLQTLRQYLEVLSSEGCESASACLRNMNWDLLDIITWPIFMVEYLLIHGSGLKPGYSIDGLNLFDDEYYKQPTEVKLELLRCLCDDVIEVDAIRTELDRRMAMADVAVELNRTMYRKSRMSSGTPGESCFSEDVREEVADGNSDECRLCKMDGNLICCDGCPAAYHSKCVGIISSRLPDGDWYCPECMIGRPNFGTKTHKLIRGAELLGNDPHGRLYFCCFDYLLVSDSYDAEASFNYYCKGDVGAVIQLLQSSYSLYGSILNAISQHWAIPVDFVPKCDWESGTLTLKVRKLDSRKRKGSSFPGYYCHLLGEDVVKPGLGTENPHTSSEGSAEVLQVNQLIPKSAKSGSKIACQATSTRSTLSAKNRKKKRSLAGRCGSFSKAEEEDVLQGQTGDGYINHYNFARTASLIVEELLRKPSDKVNVNIPKTEEEIIAIQLKFVLKKSSKCCWRSIQDLNVERRKEKCGWCYCCRFPVEGRDCLFNFTNRGALAKGHKAEVDAVLSKKNKKGHLVDVVYYFLLMEERLRGFLLGPWLSPHYSEHWRKNVLQASDVSCLKRPLLMLESNLHPLALLADWWKHVDSVTKVGSAAHFVAKSKSNITSKNAVSRRKGGYVSSETKALIASGGLGLFWWRGGKKSRSLFNWKVVPHTLALKAARKGGVIKIPGIHYPDGPENARRNKCLAWRASVETSTCLEQLALQVREFDLFVRWDDIENTHPQCILDKDSQKSARLFKKAIIRRKCVDGTHVKYLLDFGKRRCVPDVAIKHGLKLDESSDERKKFWLEESYVPLHLLKSFEERRIARKAGKKNSTKVPKGGRVMKKQIRGKGFDYLFTRAEMADSHQCGHCNKNVLISDAVSCQHCNGFFHKRHVMKSSGAITTGWFYICHKCRTVKHVKTNNVGGKRKLGKLRGAKTLKVGNRGSSDILRSKPSKKGKTLAKSRQVLSRHVKKVQYSKQRSSQRNSNVYAGMTLRRSARNANNIPVQTNTSNSGQKRKRYKSRKVASKETPKVSSWQQKRTQISHSFWLNGLQLSKKPNDERVVQFKRRKLVAPSEFSGGVGELPNCSLCSNEGFMSTSMYIGCETCGDWFHGDAFGLKEGNIECVIGFKCHVCLAKSPPVCPSGTCFSEATAEPATQDAHGLPEVLVIEIQTDCLQENHSDEIHCDHIEVETVQNSDQDQTPTLDPTLRMENVSPSSKEAVGNAIESQNGDLHEDVPTTSGESGTLEENKNISNESQQTLPVEMKTLSPACKMSEAIAIDNPSVNLKANVPVSGENVVLEENKNIRNESLVMSSDETELRPGKCVLDGMDVTYFEIAEG